METGAFPAPRRALPVFAHPRIFRIGEMAREAGPARSSGFAELDRELPGGGWPRAGLIEIGCDHTGIGELSLLLGWPSEARPSPMLWVLPDQQLWIPYAPGLLAQGLSLAQLAIVRSRDNEESLWVAEQALRSGACQTVVLWLAGSYCPALNLRRLQQAALSGGAAVFAMRPLASLAAPSPAVLRIALHAEADGGLRLDLVKRRGLPEGKSVALQPRSLPCLHRAGRFFTPSDRWLQGVLSGVSAAQRKPAPLPQT